MAYKGLQDRFFDVVNGLDERDGVWVQVVGSGRVTDFLGFVYRKDEYALEVRPSRTPDSLSDKVTNWLNKTTIPYRDIASIFKVEPR